jgi:hypothetical protein
LADISQGLSWPPNHLAQILDGVAPDSPAVTNEQLRATVDELSAALAELRVRVDELERGRRDESND